VLITAARMLHPDGVLAPGWIRVQGDRILLTGRGSFEVVDEPAVEVDVLAPGFVDIHCHGGGGASFMSPRTEEVLHAASVHRRAGTTTLLASLVTAPHAELGRQLRLLREVVDDQVLAGVHLEGPWLNPKFAGAHNRENLQGLERVAVDALLHAGAGTVRMVTLAPELTDGLQAVRHLAKADVVVGIGHTDADEECARKAFDEGARVVTHLFNAMRPVHHRAPGPVAAALTDARVAVELIADGVHLAPEVLALGARAAQGGYVLVTDAMAAASAPDGPYQLGSIKVVVKDGIAKVADSDTIAGSTLTMDKAVRTAVHAGLPLASALRAASTTAARLLGCDDRGELIAGRRADLVCLTNSLQVRAVMKGGTWVPLPT
jgi:N-acetylglucosamine-6-phosphate deacetylase